MKRVGFVLQSNPGDWLGGLSYFRNLLKAIQTNPDRRIEPVLFVQPGLRASFLAGFPAVEIIRTPLVRRLHPARIAGKAMMQVLGRDFPLEMLMRRHRIDVLSHSGTVGKRSPLASIGWIPDFQHVQIPQFFSPGEREHRDRQFHHLIAGSRRIILSSEDAMRDLAAFAPHALHKAHVLHFVSFFEDVEDTPSASQLNERFGIDRPYFHLPNQFWAHKNHRVVIEALGILRKRGIDPLVLATGKTGDYRNPGHFNALLARSRELGVEGNFRVLGLVTLGELQSLMRHAVALLNPSLFEGWSTTVEESKSLGLPIILSDIPVHLEQAPPDGRYFKADSAAELADALTEAMRNHDPDARARSRERAARLLPSRIRQFATAYEDIVHAATGKPAPLVVGGNSTR